MDKEDLFLYGDFESVHARSFRIDFIKCNERDDCKTDAEIKKFLSDKYLLILANEVWFDTGKYGESSINRTSKLRWKRFNTNFAETIPFKLSRTSLELQDMFVDFDELTELSDSSIFEFEELLHRPWAFDDLTLANISVEMNLDLQILKREGYTALDLISDIGGMQGLLFSLAATLLTFLNHNQLSNYLVSKLYLSKDQ